MSKVRIIKEIQQLSPIPSSSLERITIYDLQTMLKSLKGEKVESISNDKLKSRVKKKSKNVEFSDDEEDMFFKEAVEEHEKEVKNEIVDEEGFFEEEEEVKAVKPKPKPKKKTKIVRKKKNKVEPVEEPVEDSVEEEEIVYKPEPKTKQKRETKTKTKMKKTDEKSLLKPILEDFKVEITKLIQQYKRIRNPTQEKQDDLIDFYNSAYDDCIKECEAVLKDFKFIDDTIYDWIEGNTDKQKDRVSKLI